MTTSKEIKDSKEQQRERTDSKIMRATLEIVIAQGIGAVSIEAVSRQSGVAKTTIYRRYANADDLIRHLTLCAIPSCDFSELEPSQETLEIVLRRIIDCFDEEYELKAIGVVLSSNNDQLKNIAEHVIEPSACRFYDYIERGIQTGIFQKGLDLPFLFQTVLGSMLAYEALGVHSDGISRSDASGSSGENTSDSTDSDYTEGNARSTNRTQSSSDQAHAEWASNMAHLLWPSLRKA